MTPRLSFNYLHVSHSGLNFIILCGYSNVSRRSFFSLNYSHSPFILPNYPNIWADAPFPLDNRFINLEPWPRLIPFHQIWKVCVRTTLSIGSLNDCLGVSWNNDAFHSYTGGCWLYNEESQLASRYVNFNMVELIRVATTIVDRPISSCVNVEKLLQQGLLDHHEWWQRGHCESS